MNPLALILATGCGLALFALPRRHAPIPLLLVVCFMTLGQGLAIGPFNFTILRALVFVGLVRVVVRREVILHGLTGLDRLMIAWAVSAFLAGAFHANPVASLIMRAGIVYTELGIYLLLRCFCRTLNDAIHCIRIVGLVLVPVALSMALEHLTAHNLFASFGGVPETPQIRDGRPRAQGPFRHPILAGSAAAGCIPLLWSILGNYRKTAFAGLMACAVMIIACASSGPVGAGLAGLLGLALWRFRHRMRQLRIGLVLVYLALECVMTRPAYFIIQRLDVTGSSTGWHRAELIRSSLAHLSEWWLAGTDFTRHWMPTGVSWSEDNSDVTNHYLLNGVRGGLLPMLLILATIATAFRYVGRLVRELEQWAPGEARLVWALGCALLAHSVSFISVAYFDQTIFFYLATLAFIASVFSQAQHSVPGDAGENENAWQDAPLSAAAPRAAVGVDLSPVEGIPTPGAGMPPQPPLPEAPHPR